MYKQNTDLVFGNETGTQDFPLQVHVFSIRLEIQAHTVSINYVVCANENSFYGNIENTCSSLHTIFQLITEIRGDGLDPTRQEDLNSGLPG